MTHFYTLLSKDIDESLVCGTLDQALCQVGEDTTGAVFTELDHEGKYHTTVASVALANKWLDRFGDEVEVDWNGEAQVPTFIRNNCADRVAEIEGSHADWQAEFRAMSRDYHNSLGVSFNR